MRLSLALVAFVLGAGVAGDVDARGWPSPAAGPTMTGDPELIFTFDDGPSPQLTPLVLDALAAHQIKAVFFLVGRNVAHDKATPIIERILREGHIIANHTMTHGNLCRIADDARAADEIDKGREVIERAAGMRITWFRVPYGARCERVDAMLASRGITHFHWDLDPKEWQHNNAKKTAEYVIAQLGRMKGRNVLLMHDVKKATVEALPEILAWIQTENSRRKEARLRRIRIIQAPELAMERLPAGMLELLRDAVPSKLALARAIASVLP